MSSESFAVLRQANANGLRPETSVGKNVPFYEYLKNLRPHLGSLVQPEAIDAAVDDTDATYTGTFTYPFPQYAKENLVELLFDETKIYNSTPANIPTYKAEDAAVTRAIVASDIWHWAIMKNDTWFATNTRSFVYRIRTNTSEKAYAWEKLNINSVCDDNNRLYLGGMSDYTGSTWLTDSRFQGLVNRWIQVRGRDTLADEDTVFGTNWLFYGEAAGGASDIPYYAQTVALGIHGNTEFDKYQSLLFKLIEDGKMGFVPMRHTGEILVVKMLGTRVVAYGREGIGTFGRNEDGSLTERPVKKDIGINARGCVGGTRDQHVFVDSNANLWHFEENATAPVYDGFSEFMPTSGHRGNITHADWNATNEPQGIASIASTNTILTFDSGYFKEFDYHGNLVRRVAVPAGVLSPVYDQIACDGTYVAVRARSGAGVAILNYSDLSLLILSDVDFLGAGVTPTILVLGGGFLYIGGAVRTIYKRVITTLAAAPGLGSLILATGEIGSGSLTSGCWDGTDTVWAGAGGKLAKVSTALVLGINNVDYDDDPVADDAEYMTYISSINKYLINSRNGSFFQLRNADLTFYKLVPLPATITVLDALGVAALGNRLYLGDDTNNYIIMFDYNPVMVSYDCLWKEYWISAAAKSYIYSDGKLGGPMDWSVTSLFRDSVNKLTGITYDNASGDREVELRSVPLNFGEHGEKQVIEFVMDSEGVNTRRACVAWRNDHRLTFKNSPWVPFSPQGVAFPICSFVDGKVRVKAEINEDELAEIQRIEVRYIATDLRFRRGMKAEIGAL